MTYTFYSQAEGRYLIYDTASGAVIPAGELDAYICDALDPCGEKLHLPEKCPSEIRYELARFSSTEVSQAYLKIKEYYAEGLIFGDSDKILLRLSGAYSADDSIVGLVCKETGYTRGEIVFVP